MPGLIGLSGATTQKDSLFPGAPKTSDAAATGYDPAQFEVDPGKQTVAGQLTSLLSSGNPYLEAARSGAMETANSRGVLNSSMAAGAGEAAAINSALPVASADASTYNNAENFNKSADNTALQFGANTENQAGLIGTQTEAQKQIAQQAADIQTGQVLPAQTAAQKELTAATGEQQRQTLAQSGQQDIATQTLRGEQATDLANIEAQYKTLIQASASAADVMKNASGAVGAIMADTTTTTEQKQAAVNTVSQLVRSSLAVSGSIADLDLTSLLNFSA